MPRGRPRLDADVKHQHVQESRKRYEEQNSEKRREDARLRMQRKRAQIAAADFHTRLKYRERSASHSEKYRDRKSVEERKERCARNAVNKQARRLEEEQLRRDHKAIDKPQQRKAPIAIRGVPLKAAKWRAASPATPTPTPRRHATIPALVAEGKDDPSEDNSNEESTPHRLEAPVWPIRASQPVQCQWCHAEDCCGCACMCDESSEWIQHEGGHFFPTCEKCELLLSLSMSTPYGVLLCTPKYKPDPGHEDRLKHTGGFFAIDCDDWKGVMTSEETYLKMKENYPDVSTFYAPTWFLFHKHWVLECTEYHNHEIRVPQQRPVTPSSSPPSSPPSSPSTLSESTVSRAPSPTPAPSSEPTKKAMKTRHKLKSVTPKGEQVVKGDSHGLSKEDLAHLAAFRPPPVPLSPERANQQFARTLGPKALIRDDPRRAIHAAPMLYAVEGHRRFFQKRDQAILCLKGTPGAELAFSRDVSELFDFLASIADEKTQWRERAPVKATNTLYGVSGHKRVFIGRDRAVAVLTHTPGAELVFSSDEDEFWDLLAAANRTT
ncbi:hypothetical protein DFH07DRAFT_766057 [Mycena maculata]|uniref:Uncharacterized protein n=1 Tax=Mycena maculata TaxID=230809 RepID=A0AAD7K5W7_9AGAR|nr:hypothetical protein DFH07DRAFT_766057 [Mycena maculata]